MKKLNMMVMTVALCAAAVVRAQGASVAVVDMEELVRLHPNTVSDKKLLEQTLKEYKAEGTELQRKLESLQEDFDKSRKEAADQTLSEKARKVAEDEAVKAREAFTTADRKARETMQQRQQDLQASEMRMLKRTTAEIREAVEKYAAEKKIQFVLPANQVVYFDKTFDITDVMMQRLNIQRAAKDDASPAKAIEDGTVKPGLPPATKNEAAPKPEVVPAAATLPAK